MLDVIILNAYHRGDWLVEQYKNTPYAVEVLDISDVIGPRDEADVRGPFGSFAGVDASVDEWLLKTRTVTRQKEGWVLWCDRGTFQSQGLFRGYESEVLGDVCDTVMKSWLSTTDRPAALWRSLPAVLPQSENGYLLTKSFLNMPEKRRAVKSADSFSLTSETNRKVIKWNDHTFESRFVVSFLLPHELMARAPVGLNQLLTAEPIKPRLCWQRARFRIETSFDLAALPEQLCWVNRLEDPWFEENMLVLAKTENSSEFDIWFRTWFEVHKEKKYFSGLQKRLQAVLASKFSDAAIACVQAPLETTDKGAQSLYPVYDLQEWALHTKFLSGGIFYGGDDKYESFAPRQAVQMQSRIFKQIDEELKGG